MSTARLRARGVPRDDHADYAPDSPVHRIHGDYVDRVRGRRASGSCRARACARRRLRPPRRPHVITPTTTDGHRHASHEGHRGDHRPARPLPAYQPGLSADRHGHRQGLSPRPKPAIGKSRAVGVDNLTSRTAPRGWPIAYRPRRPHGLGKSAPAHRPPGILVASGGSTQKWPI